MVQSGHSGINIHCLRGHRMHFIRLPDSTKALKSLSVPQARRNLCPFSPPLSTKRIGRAAGTLYPQPLCWLGKSQPGIEYARPPLFHHRCRCGGSICARRTEIRNPHGTRGSRRHQLTAMLTPLKSHLRGTTKHVRGQIGQNPQVWNWY